MPIASSSLASLSGPCWPRVKQLAAQKTMVKDDHIRLPTHLALARLFHVATNSARFLRIERLYALYLFTHPLSHFPVSVLTGTPVSRAFQLGSKLFDLRLHVPRCRPVRLKLRVAFGNLSLCAD
jgi:hypothetical protein